MLFNSKNKELITVKEKPFKLEKEIQKLFEANLKSIMGLEFVKSEFSIKNRRIDTLAFDVESSAFIIIEYKRDKNISVIDQGFTYLSLMLENKADFIIEYNESLGKHLKREDVDWSQTRVAFVSPHFTDNQIMATNFKDIAIELWEIKQFENETVLITPIKKSNSAESIKPITTNTKELKEVIDEIKVYTEEEHKAKANDFILELYEKFKLAILGLADNIEAKAKKQYIGFVKERNLCSIVILKGSLNIFINLKSGYLDDPKNLALDVSQIGHWGVGDYRIKTETDKDLEYIMSLVKQAL